MTNADLHQYKDMLESKLRELETSVHNLDAIAVERAADFLDELQLVADREFAVRDLDRKAVLLGHVRAALERVSNGGYGVCLKCQERISPKRLRALPWATLCIDCQEAADREQLPMAA